MPLKALTVIIINVANTLGINESKGKLAVGYDTNIVYRDIEKPAELVYQFGASRITCPMRGRRFVI